MMSIFLASLVLTNGKIWTGDGSRPAAQAILIDGNRIAAVGTSEEIAARTPPGARVIDLRGRLAVPGFIDNHTHFIDGGMQISRVMLRDAATPQEFARRIGEYAKKAGKGKWINVGEC